MITLSGLVVHGKGLGHQHNMATANIDCDASGIKMGVYGGYAYVDDISYLCLVNIGKRPSVDNDERITVEAYLLDFNQNIYGKLVTLQLPYFLRDTIKFNNLDEVREQIDKDIQTLKDLVK